MDYFHCTCMEECLNYLAHAFAMPNIFICPGTVRSFWLTIIFDFYNSIIYLYISWTFQKIISQIFKLLGNTNSELSPENSLEKAAIHQYMEYALVYASCTNKLENSVLWVCKIE